MITVSCCVPVCECFSQFAGKINAQGRELSVEGANEAQELQPQAERRHCGEASDGLRRRRRPLHVQEAHSAGCDEGSDARDVPEVRDVNGRQLLIC